MGPSRMIQLTVLGLLGLLLHLDVAAVGAFNLETRHFAIYRRENGTMFGFSVAAYRDKTRRGWVIVGAPEAGTDQFMVDKAGATYKCDIAVDDKCDYIRFDPYGNSHLPDKSSSLGYSEQQDNKTLQWFGATVSASQVDGGPIMACAPRYVWLNNIVVKDERMGHKKLVASNYKIEPVGTCYVARNNFQDMQEYAPCRTQKWGYHMQGWCQAGLGAAVSKAGERVFIGAPGAWYWQGQFFSISSDLTYTAFFTPTHIYPLIDETTGQVFSRPLSGRAKVMSTKEGPITDDDNYMGYSVTAGNFEGNGDSGAAVGVPHAADLFGKVILFSSTMRNLRNLTGDQMGAYFGYSLAGGDVDGDGFEDLIVGAPMYTIRNNPEMFYETGRVYVYYQGAGPDKYLGRTTLDGEANRGRFGLSVAYIGDVNHDGYGDIAVGAPYVDGGVGAVYVFHGSRDGVVEKCSQAIYPRDLGLWELPRTFGFSVAGGLDLDNNGYTDLLVGAYESNSAMFFRARPVIKMDSYVRFDVKSKLISVDIVASSRDKQAETETCVLNDDRSAVCFVLTACLKYTGDGIFPKHTFNVQYVLDVKKPKSPRLFFYEYQDKSTLNESVPVAVGQLWCKSRKVFVTPNIRDKLTSLDAELRISIDEHAQIDNGPRNPAMALRPALGTTTSQKDSLSIRKNCGADDVCIPDLRMVVEPSVDKYLLGSGNRFELDVLVRNNGEDAFETTYNLRLPSGIDYINIQRASNTDFVVHCSAPKQSNNNTLRCDLGNPLPQDQVVHFKVFLQPVSAASMKPTYEFDMDVNSANAEDNSTTGDNSFHLSLPLFTQTELIVEGESKLKDIYYNPANYTSTNVTSEIEFGPSVVHNYTIRNQGPSEILEAVAFLIWPAKTLAGDELLYLLEQPETAGNIRCATADANYLNLKLEQRRRIYIPPNQSRIYGTSQSSTIQVTPGFDGSSKKDENPIDVDKESSRKYHSNSTFTNSTVSKDVRVDGTTIVHKTFSQNSSSTSTSTGGLSTESRSVIIGAQGGGVSSFGAGQHGIDIHQTSHVEQSGGQWGAETGAAGDVLIDQSESERRYQEYLRQQSLQRQREDEARRVKLEDEKRLKIVEEEAFRIREEQRLSLQRKHEEQERHRILEEQRLAQQRQQEETERRRFEEEQRLALQRRIDEEQQRLELQRQREEEERSRQTQQGSASGGVFLHNFTSTQELQRIFGALTKESSDYEVYSSQGKQYVQFMGRFRTTADGREFMEFQDGSRFPLLTSYGSDSYAPDPSGARDSRFLRIKGELSVDPSGKGYIVLKDGRKFVLQGSYSYTEERRYTIGGGGAGTHGYTETRNVEGQTNENYGRTWHEQSSSRTGDKDVESSYRSRTYSERQYAERRGSQERQVDGYDGNDDEVDPNHVSSRFKRETDDVSVEEFEEFEKLRRRRPRENRFSPLEGAIPVNEKTVEQTPICETAQCYVLRCELGPLKKNEEVWIGARYLISAQTLKKIAYQEKIKLSTQLVTEQTLMPIIGKPAIPQTKSHVITTNVEPTASSSTSNMVQLWVVVLSAVAGTVILLLLIFLLYKCGFFKRNRPSDAPERQPLNRNGHFQQEDH